MASDSLSARGEIVSSCDTYKLHPITNQGVAGGCGRSYLGSQPWSTVLQPCQQAASMPHDSLVDYMRNFLDQAVSSQVGLPVGGLAPGNEFVIASYDPAGRGIVISQIVRRAMQNHFEPISVHVSSAAEYDHISWYGDTASVGSHIATIDAAYQPLMTERDATVFALDAVRGAIGVSAASSKRTIGGDYINIAVVRHVGAMSISRQPSGFPCTVATVKSVAIAANEQ